MSDEYAIVGKCFAWKRKSLVSFRVGKGRFGHVYRCCREAMLANQKIIRVCSLGNACMKASSDYVHMSRIEVQLVCLQKELWYKKTLHMIVRGSSLDISSSCPPDSTGSEWKSGKALSKGL